MDNNSNNSNNSEPSELEQVNQEVARMLKQIREETGLTQEQLVEAIGEAEYFVSVRTYQRYEAGQTTCPAWVLKRVELLREQVVIFEKNDLPTKLLSRSTILLLREKIRMFFS